MPRSQGKGPGEPHGIMRAFGLFPFIALSLMSGCRESTPVTGPGPEIRLSMRMTAGDTYIFSRWDLDQYGYPITSTEVQESWRVLQTGVAAHGDTGVTIVADSTGSGRTDTLFFRFTTGGDVYGWGFLARVSADMGAGVIPEEWDLLVHSGVGPGTSWASGVDDSAGTDTVYASFESQSDYFSGTVNGMSTVFQAYPVDLTGQRIVCTMWVSDSPTCFAGMREESTLAGNGFASYVTAMTVARR